ncbi:site-specific recombinase [Corallococcus exiguus]|uniref:site-specific recombinase n=1 Tax=Corallococcus TaxID=83461 RepID=UPI000EBAA6EE|nr:MULTISPECIES: site-specific recombinase [Corallococcus]NNB89499.1 site-specific recombinase [Corallococcus exiguus]NNB96076.1 site-specific recombinase [Corallococcus exiguus]NNC06100.1 site-specific recombinase [Corallococcus exiguus]NPC51328.1 site-specific recombinase [Corallococcus exiguus]RKH79854.1 gliding motility protein [Corallococcus sp. AB032C]
MTVSTPAPRLLLRGVPSDREMDAFCVQYAPRAPGHPAVRDLLRLLSEVPDDGLEPRLEWVERWIHWMRDRIPAHGLTDADDPALSPSNSRLSLLVRVLEGEGALRASVTRLVAGVCASSRGLKLFAQVGLSAGNGFFSELTDRLVRGVLPTPPEPGKLSELLLRLFPVPEDAEWLGALSPMLLARLTALVGEPPPPEPTPSARVRGDLMDALLLLGVQVAALGLAEDVRDRTPDMAFRASPFLRLRLVCDAVLARDGAQEALADLVRVVEDCRGVVRTVTRHLEDSGVSVDLVYRLERIQRGLDRMEAVARVLGAPRGEPRWREALALLSDLLRLAHADRSVRALVRRNSRLMARKIIERTGNTGEHYITSTPAEFHHMVHSAAGGGFLTAFAAALKFVVTGLPLAPFFAGLFVALNYAGAFVMMQLLGLTLATKQPSMTASTLAAAVGEDTGPDSRARRMERLTALVPRVTRSQLAAILGNLGCVLPVAVALALGFQALTGHAFLSQEKARHVVDTLHPWKSATLLYAALTGVLLWASSVAAGWFENFIVYRRLPEALAHHRVLRVLVGVKGARKVADALEHHAAGVGGSITLGVLLTVAPGVGSFFGIPMDVRHVTFSFGSLALAGCALGTSAVMEPGFLAAVAGVLVVGIVNFGVSFSLALGVALRARDVPVREGARFLGAVSLRFLRNPLPFLLPPRDEPVPGATEGQVLPLAGPPAQ